MALDEPQAGDEVIREDGLTFLVEKPLWEMSKPIRVDFTQTQPDAEYTVTSTLMERNTNVADNPKAWQAPACSLI